MRNFSIVPCIASSLMFAPQTETAKGSAQAQAAPKEPINPFALAFTVRGFKRSKGKDVSYDSGVTTGKRLADVIMEAGSGDFKTGMLVTGVSIHRIKHLADNGPNKAGKIDLILKWTNKGGPAWQPVFVTETNESEANREAFVAGIIAEFDKWFAADAAQRGPESKAPIASATVAPVNAAIYE